MECKQHKDIKKPPQCKQRNNNNKKTLLFGTVQVDYNRRPRWPGVTVWIGNAMKTSEEERAGVITVLQARESDCRNQTQTPSTVRPPPFQPQPWWAGSPCAFFLCYIWECKQFLPPPGRRYFVCILNWFSQSISLYLTRATWSRSQRRDWSVLEQWLSVFKVG